MDDHAKDEDIALRAARLRDRLVKDGADAALVTSNVNLFYFTGRISDAFLYLPANGEPIRFVRRQGEGDAGDSVAIRKPEDIPGLLRELGLPVPESVLLEDEDISAAEWQRLSVLFRAPRPGSAVIRALRAVKTPGEIAIYRRSARRHAELYAAIPALYRPGMTELRFSAEIEREARLRGHLGVFRAFGRRMEIFMGSILTGDNASATSPFDFALGGQGQHPSSPVGMTGGPLRQGTTVMVDMSGNFEGYLTDMTRVFRLGSVPDEVDRCHRCALEIQEELAAMGKSGVLCGEMYDRAVSMATRAGLADRFMGLRRQARFVGHGVGIEINEPPVLAAGSRAMLEAGNIIALEPKFVLPGIGAAGIENTWLVTTDGMEKLTLSPEGILPL